jgi:hypothetical protein
VNLTSEKQAVNIPMTSTKLYKLGAAKPTVVGKNLKLTLTSSGYAVYSTKQ